jgi:hypothetical protein
MALFQFEYIKIEYSEVNFRQTINIFFVFPWRKPWDENVHEWFTSHKNTRQNKLSICHILRICHVIYDHWYARDEMKFRAI